MVVRDMRPMTQTSITALEKAVEVAGLINACSLVIVDNSSLEPLRKEKIVTDIPFEIIRLDKRHSFSAASNSGAKKLATYESLLFLNNDVFLHPEALKTMISDQLNFSSSICGARLVYPNGQIQHVGVGFGKGNDGPHHLHHYEQSRVIPRITAECQAVTGAVILIDSFLFSKLQGFDENYPFAYEDVDFCLRATGVGAKIICSQKVDSIHLSGQTRDEETKVFEKLSRDMFFARWGGRVGSLLL